MDFKSPVLVAPPNKSLVKHLTSIAFFPIAKSLNAFLVAERLQPHVSGNQVDLRTLHLKPQNGKRTKAPQSFHETRRAARGGWQVANLLKCNLHSCGWISHVGVLYKGIWPPVELHDIQAALWQVWTHTHTRTSIQRD